MRITLFDVQAMKPAGQRIAMLTAYDHPSAVLAERAGVPMLLVGDSLGMAVHGFDTTLPVTLDDMIRHARAVVRGTSRALVVADLPFLTYATEADAIASARRVMQEAGVQALKLEGGATIAPTVRRLTELGVPVMGHLGLTPQSQHTLGLRVQARQAAEARRLLDDALALQDAGAFAIVLELVPTELAQAVTRRLQIPVIGIGAGAGCDGQVQVWHDILGLFPGKSPRHAKRFAEIGTAIEDALRAYVSEVQSGTFPTEAQSSRMKPDELSRALNAE
ncbi:3-methyl-2-oxobutanoate hydroxymethyltransferase [Gluconacetobacter diazotrophicus PA1 5]|uniref:3-methyl-2-oxobutanoate hydroxymethyltransferase n=1 Tax=Gluconacetobacter diazotrophicus (strain ATCC 49037 / DSM 5601 / CCUG 37298 / CIP 103539 / LMG 7603 / PAl5) TaxID=272568 RepID=PANB_GLUDA|nr:3-methyl-2-oxobutanoate hydroxymethyltransferase [Gluconacetobacter diazotrophicus]A9H9N2.1 RecName: Full=3-methyl-2-oxobutanoate hydroxymethyltransferase; AltName: Full=Ketopantoate hydroxymethyltransferase; Short=KPHMT [Gluconacetobacter diazotrophicus PA1 5]ACI52402.1 3-methyl-2-oxobutanoate hydroxymethyltransferase [Gluconacetobacter diazotrophicus PA1 5]TWA98206.1 ketopantoate hydroxymethyltransferase [Gluconacetobacter diazotrophicus]CAP57731.1 3-methyl-2-oxobutanoate hydroxymethyltran